MPIRTSLLGLALLTLAMPHDLNPLAPGRAEAMPRRHRPPELTAAPAPAGAPCRSCRKKPAAPVARSRQGKHAVSESAGLGPDERPAAASPVQVPALAYYWPKGAPVPALVAYAGRVEGDDLRGPAVRIRTADGTFQTYPEWVFTLTDMADRLAIHLHNLPGLA